MKYIVPALLGVMAITVHATHLDLNTATIPNTGIETALATFSAVQSVTANTGGEVLVIGTFSSRAQAVSGLGEWQLSYGGQTSKPITRSLDARRDIGISSVTHIFTGVTSGESIDLQHRYTGNNHLDTFGVNLVTIPLTTSTGDKLNYKLKQQDTGFQTTSQNFVSTGMETTLRLDRSSNNGIYMAASFNSQSITTAETGTWQLQYRKKDTEPWIDTGSPISRSMSTTSDKGAVTLYALEEGLEAGEYEIQLAGKSTAGATVETLNGTLAAVSLSYTNATGGGYFDGFSVTTNSLSIKDTLPYEGAQADLSLELAPEETAGIFASMNFMTTADAAEAKGLYDIYFENKDTGSDGNNQYNRRFFYTNSDLGSGGSVGYFSGLESGDYTIYGRLNDEKENGEAITAPEVTLVGFSTQAIPEPAVATLIIGFGGALLAGRRFFMK